MSGKLGLCGLLAALVLGCQGQGEQGSSGPSQTNPDSTGRVHAAQRPPDGGMPDGGVFHPKLEKVEPQAGACPAGEYRCCDGSCSPDKGCPQVSCGNKPASE